MWVRVFVYAFEYSFVATIRVCLYVFVHFLIFVLLSSLVGQMWGVGVVLWEMLAAAPGQVPYDWIDTWDELTELVQQGDARVDLRLRLPTDPQWAALTALARQCMDRDPDQRPTAAQACARLRGSDMDSRLVRCRVRGSVCFLCFAYVR